MSDIKDSQGHTLTTFPLAPCPFCGRPATMERAVVWPQQWFGVVCRSGLGHGGDCAMQQVPSRTIEAAAKRWNMRKATAEQAQVEPVACAHEWSDDGEFMLVCTACGAQENHDPKWLDMATAPRDGTMLRLLVRFEEHSTEDDEDAPTIGSNNFDNDGDDRWQFAGWCWSHDHFVDGKGEPLGWMPMLDTPHADLGEVERLQLEIEKLRLSLTMNDDALIQDGFVRIENRALRSRIDEQNELLREIKSARDWNGSYRALEKRIDAALSASAEPKCETCKGNGVIGWRRGQTAESYEEGESTCEDCAGTGYAHIQGMPVPGTCDTCKGTGEVPDGVITGVGVVDFENGHIQCVKDCPDCKPAK